MQRKVLYFSTWPFHRSRFSLLLRKYEKVLDIIEVGCDAVFSQASDLLLFLNTHQEIVKDLYVIIDYLPFFASSCNYEKSADLIRKAILGYPEVFFLFDESLVRERCPQSSFSTFLFTNKSQSDDLHLKEYHMFLSASNSPFEAIRNHRDNLYDGTNLRYCVKQCHYDELNVTRNFVRVQDSRKGHMAICVEEEAVQNRFDSYALYANGFRVLPIMTATELWSVNKNYNSALSPIDLIVRDYDIQFSDADPENSCFNIPKVQIHSLNNEYSTRFNLVDFIRGAKKIEEQRENSKANSVHWVGLESKSFNGFWNKMLSIPRLYVSKGDQDLEPTLDERKFKRHRPNGVQQESNINSLLIDCENKQYLVGMQKPVTGIYNSFQGYDAIRKRYYKGVDWNNVKDSSDGYYLKTSRREHQHGMPLDIYDLAKTMIDRATVYQKEGDYVLSSILASEAIEVLNGFHESLMLNAYKIYAVSENAMVMSIMGGDEEGLSLDTSFRITKITAEVRRLMKRESGDRRKVKYNVLNQIFCECRTFCREKEHFEAENRFISAMAHVNEGFEYHDIFLEMKDIFDKWIVNVGQFIHIFRHAEKKNS